MNPSLLLAATLLTADAEFKKVSETDGITLEQRSVEGSAFVELRVTSTSTKSVKALCDAVFGDGKFDAEEPNLKAREIVFESENERVTYEQITPPLVSNRDYLVRVKRTMEDNGVCRVQFAAATDIEKKSPEGWVRITKLRGGTTVEPLPDGKARVTYSVFSDPGGAIPPFLVEGSRRTLAINWMRLIIKRAK